MNLLNARKEMENLVAAWKKAGIESIREGLRKGMIIRLQGLERLEVYTSDCDYELKLSPEMNSLGEMMVANTVDYLENLREASPQFTREIDKVLVQLL